MNDELKTNIENNSNKNYIQRESEKHPIITMIRQKADDEFVRLTGTESYFKNIEVNKYEDSISNLIRKIKNFAFQSKNYSSSVYSNIKGKLSSRHIDTITTVVNDKFEEAKEFMNNKTIREINSNNNSNLNKPITDEVSTNQLNGRTNKKLISKIFGYNSKDVNETVVVNKENDNFKEVMKENKKSSINKFFEFEWLYEKDKDLKIQDKDKAGGDKGNDRNIGKNVEKSSKHENLLDRKIDKKTKFLKNNKVFERIRNVIGTIKLSFKSIFALKSDVDEMQSIKANKNQMLEIIKEKAFNDSAYKNLQKRRFYNFIRMIFSIRPTWVIETGKKVIKIENKAAESIFYKIFICLKPSFNWKYTILLAIVTGITYYNSKNDINKKYSSYLERTNNSSKISINQNFIENEKRKPVQFSHLNFLIEAKVIENCLLSNENLSNLSLNIIINSDFQYLQESFNMNQNILLCLDILSIISYFAAFGKFLFYNNHYYYLISKNIKYLKLILALFSIYQIRIFSKDLAYSSFTNKIISTLADNYYKEQNQLSNSISLDSFKIRMGLAYKILV